MSSIENSYKQEMLRILDFIDKTLTQNNIWYSLAYGSVLGAVRENGFIPWDRDVDTFIKITDRKRVRQLLKASLPDEWLYLDSSIDNVNTFDNIRSRKYGEFAQVDIYTLYGAPDVSKMSRFQIRCILNRNKFCTKVFCAKYGDWRKLRKKYKIIPYFALKGFLRLIPDKFIRDIITHFETKDNIETAPFLMSMVTYRRPGDLMRREIFDKTVRHKFEDIEVNIPAEYQKYCEQSYGKDYMTPKQFNWH